MNLLEQLVVFVCIPYQVGIDHHKRLAFNATYNGYNLQEHSDSAVDLQMQHTN